MSQIDVIEHAAYVAMPPSPPQVCGVSTVTDDAAVASHKWSASHQQEPSYHPSCDCDVLQPSGGSGVYILAEHARQHMPRRASAPQPFWKATDSSLADWQWTKESQSAGSAGIDIHEATVSMAPCIQLQLRPTTQATQPAELKQSAPERLTARTSGSAKRTVSSPVCAALPKRPRPSPTWSARNLVRVPAPAGRPTATPLYWRA